MPDARDWTEGPFVRVFWDFPADHPAVYDSLALRAWWLDLLILASQTYPAAAPFPRSITDDVVEALVEDGVIDRVGDDRYRMHGLARLRGQVTRRGIAGGLARARAGARDNAGRYRGGHAGPADGEVAGPVAGRSAGELNGDAGRGAGALTLEDTLVQRQRSGAGPAHAGTSDLVQRPSDVDVDIDLEPDPSKGQGSRSLSTTPPPRAPAREGDEAGGPVSFGTTRGHRANAPATLDTCDDPKAHRPQWAFMAGTWRCPLCVAARRETEPSFAERMARYSDPEDGPF